MDFPCKCRLLFKLSNNHYLFGFLQHSDSQSTFRQLRSAGLRMRNNAGLNWISNVRMSFPKSVRLNMISSAGLKINKNSSTGCTDLGTEVQYSIQNCLWGGRKRWKERKARKEISSYSRSSELCSFTSASESKKNKRRISSIAGLAGLAPFGPSLHSSPTSCFPCSW